MTKLSDYTKIKRLGSGQFGEAWKVRRKGATEDSCLKFVDLSQLSEKGKNLQRREGVNLGKIHSPYVIRLLNTFEESNMLLIETEFCEGGSLDDAIEKKRKDKIHFSEDEIWKYLIQLCFGIISMNSSLVIHRDLKPENVLLDKNGNIKIGDLGISKQLNSKDSRAQTIIGDRFHIAPELLREEEYGIEVDAWGLGCIGYELCCLVPPFFLPLLLDFQIMSMDPDPIPQAEPGKVGGYSKLLCETVHSLLKKNPEERLKVVDILNNPEVKRIGRRLNIDMGPATVLKTVRVRYVNDTIYRMTKSEDDCIECDLCHLRIAFKDYFRHCQTHYPAIHKLLKK